MLNVHALGGVAMMRAAREAIDAAPHKPILTGVTILTSHNDSDMAEIGLAGTPAGEVQRLARLVKSAGLDGVVCSPLEARMLRESHGPEFILVTPGVRSESAGRGDQQRTLTAATALREGANFLVIGRPITRAADPALALELFRNEIGEAACAPS
jgi:orotidine-5'-phosphate decarboxylase